MSVAPRFCIRALLIVGLIPLAGCGSGPVTWKAPAPAPDSANTANMTTLVVDSAGGVSFAPAPRAPATMPPADICPGTARVAWRTPQEVYAAWWTRHADGSAAVWAAHSPDGGATWDAPVPVDTTDVGSAGCDRPAPSIAASGDYVHVAYGMWAKEGAGVFFSHSMDRGKLFHAPVPIVYGDRPGTASVAAHGDTVVVAYQDPNTSPLAIGLALSTTMGHIFENRVRASAARGAATDPLVAISGSTVAVSWLRHMAQGASSTGTTERMVRVGHMN